MKDIEDYKYGIAVFDSKIQDQKYVDLVHIALYKEKPTENDMNSLKEELKNDPEFGLTKISER